MKRTSFGLLAASIAFVFSIHSAAAQGQITNLIVATDKNATSGLETVPAGTKSLWAIFDYEGAGDSEFAVVMMSPGGLVMFTDDHSYSGQGKAEVEISGAAIYANIMTELKDVAEATESALVKVATQQQVTQYASDAVMGINQMRPLVDMVESSDYRGLDQQQLSTLTASMDSLLDLKGEMGKATDDTQKRDVAEQMEPHVATLMTAVEALSGASVPDFPIPPSPVQTAGGEYLIKIEVDGSPSKSTEFWVYGDTAQAPGSTTGGTPTQPAGGAGGPAGVGGKPTTAAGSPTKSAAEGAPAADSGADASGSVTGLTASGQSVVGARGGPTATPPGPNAELPAPGAVDAPAGAEAPVTSGDQGQQMDTGAAAPTAITAKGVVNRVESASGGSGDGLAGGSGSGPNFAMLLVGVVVLAGVAVFMKGRM